MASIIIVVWFFSQHVWVMPNSSARCAQLPRAVDKVPFYEGLRRFRDFIKGNGEEPTEEELTFASIKLKNFNEGSPHKKLMAALAGANDHLVGPDGQPVEFKVIVVAVAAAVAVIVAVAVAVAAVYC